MVVTDVAGIPIQLEDSDRKRLEAKKRAVTRMHKSIGASWKWVARHTKLECTGMDFRGKIQASVAEKLLSTNDEEVRTACPLTLLTNHGGSAAV